MFDYFGIGLPEIYFQAAAIPFTSYDIGPALDDI